MSYDVCTGTYIGRYRESVLGTVLAGAGDLLAIFCIFIIINNY